MDTRIPEWEYKKIPPIDHRHDPNVEQLVLGHRLGLIKRRRYKTESKWSEFQPYCSCKKWKSKIWFRTRFLAGMQHYEHAKAFQERNPSLFDKKEVV